MYIHNRYEENVYYSVEKDKWVYGFMFRIKRISEKLKIEVCNFRTSSVKENNTNASIDS